MDLLPDLPGSHLRPFGHLSDTTARSTLYRGPYFHHRYLYYRRKSKPHVILPIRLQSSRE